MKTMPAGLFKVHCLKVMDEVALKREPVVITKRGKPVAKLVPLSKEKDDIFGFFNGKGTIEIKGDIVSPSSLPKNGAIFIDPARHSRGAMARAGLSSDIRESAVSHQRSSQERPRIGGPEHRASRNRPTGELWTNLFEA